MDMIVVKVGSLSTYNSRTRVGWLIIYTSCRLALGSAVTEMHNYENSRASSARDRQRQKERKRDGRGGGEIEREGEGKVRVEGEREWERDGGWGWRKNERGG